MYKKGMVLAIIGLFIGVSIVPSITGNIEQISNSRILLSVEEKSKSNNEWNDITTLNPDSIAVSDFESDMNGWTVVGDGLKVKLEQESIEELTEIIDLIEDTPNYSFGNYSVMAMGPILRLISKVTLQDGPILTKLLFNRNLNRRLLRLTTILPMAMVYPVLRELDFKIEFLRDVRNNTRYMYCTIISEVEYDENGTYIGLKNSTGIYSKAHAITVENFRGYFGFKKFRFLLLRAPLGQKIFNPARFATIGFCDNVIVE